MQFSDIKADWLIVFFIHEIQQYAKYSKTLKDQIESSGNGNNNLILLIEDSFTQDDNGVEGYLLKLSILIKHADGTYKFEEIQLPNLKESNPLEQIFIEVFKVNCKRRLLLTWSHGAGFGINVDEIPVDEKAKLFRENNIISDDQIIEIRNSRSYVHLTENTKNIWSRLVSKRVKQDASAILSIDNSLPTCNQYEILWITLLADMLKSALKDTKIDLMMMVNCNMQVFDTGYLLRNNVKYLVAPESKMWAYGYNYLKLLTTINSTPEIKLKELNKKIIRDYKKKYTTINGGKDFMASTTLFIKRLKYYNLAFIVFDHVTQTLIKNLDLWFTDLMQIRENEIYPVSNSISIDLIDVGLWLKLLSLQKPFSKDIKPMYTLYNQLNSLIVTEKHVGSALKSEKKYGHSGTSIFFPSTANYKDQDIGWCAFNNSGKTKFYSKAFHWDNFLEKYYKSDYFITRSINASNKNKSDLGNVK